MGEFKPTEILHFAKPTVDLSEEELYWQNWESNFESDEGTCISCIDISGGDQPRCAVACRTKVALYDFSNGKCLGEVGRFKHCPLSASFRADGQLIALTDESNSFRVYSLSTMTAQRYFNGHNSGVRMCHFNNDGYQLASFSDDFTVKHWQLATSTCLRTFTGHTDSVRCGICRSNELIVSGSYDRSVRVWDTRLSDCVQQFDHGFPVESIALDDDNKLLVVAGGTVISVWDFATGKRISQLSRHFKTVTQVHFCSNNSRFMSASLDRHLKVYDCGSLNVVADVKFDHPILAISVKPDNSALAVGTSSGRLLIKTKKDKDPASAGPTFAKSAESKVVRQKQTYTVKKAHTKTFEVYDKLLMSFQYRKLLTYIVDPQHCKTQPDVTITMLAELMRRGVLRKTLSALSEETVLRILNFLIHNVRQPEFTLPLLEVASDFIDVCCPKVFAFSPIVKEKFIELRNILQSNVNSLFEATKLVGFMQSILLQ